MQAEFKGTQGEMATLRADKFRWNVPLDPSIFEPDIPDDYTIVE
jgi:outer membrane lipoprotein-sorting protein